MIWEGGSATTNTKQSDYLSWWLAILQLFQTGMQHYDYMPILAMPMRVSDLLALSASIRLQVACNKLSCNNDSMVLLTLFDATSS
jgi:hypothetical protein